MRDNKFEPGQAGLTSKEMQAIYFGSQLSDLADTFSKNRVVSGEKGARMCNEERLRLRLLCLCNFRKLP